MNQAPIKLGPLALLLTVISICLTTLSILTFTTARADRRLAEKYADTITGRYEQISEGADFLEEAQAALTAGTPLSALPDTHIDAEGITWYEPENEDYQLSVGVISEQGELQIVSYRIIKTWNEDLDIGNLWPGF